MCCAQVFTHLAVSATLPGMAARTDPETASSMLALTCKVRNMAALSHAEKHIQLYAQTLKTHIKGLTFEPPNFASLVEAV